MDGQAGGHRTQIVIALIGLFGVLITALLSNWDKIFPDRAASAAGREAAAAPATSDVAPGVPPIESAQRLSDAQKNALNASSSALEGITAQISATGTETPDIGGNWRDDEGYDYAVWHKPPYFGFRQFRVGQETSTAEGETSGLQVRHHYRAADGDEGDCIGTIEAGGNVISGTCTSGKVQWPFRVMRGGGKS